MFFSNKCKGQKKNLCSQRDWSSENDTKGDFSLKYLRICKKQSENLTFWKGHWQGIFHVAQNDGPSPQLELRNGQGS